MVKKKPPKKKTEDPILKEAEFKREDVAKKLIPLNVLSGREAERAADRAIDNVLCAITHVFGEGDVALPDFGLLKASKNQRTGQIRIIFIASGKLKQAVEARLNALPAPPAPAESAGPAQPVPEQTLESQVSAQSSTESAPLLPVPDQVAAPGGESQASAEPSQAPSETGAELQTPPEALEPVESSHEASGQTVETTGEVQETSSLEPSPGSTGSEPAATEVFDTGAPSEASEESKVRTIESVSLEGRTLLANDRQYGIAENLTILDVNDNVMNFADLTAALQHLALVSKIAIISETAFRVQAVSTITIINILKILQYRGQS